MSIWCFPDFWPTALSDLSLFTNGSQRSSGRATTSGSYRKCLFVSITGTRMVMVVPERREREGEMSNWLSILAFIRGLTDRLRTQLRYFCLSSQSTP